MRAAKPGHSEHQTGLAIDLYAVGGTPDAFNRYRVYAWMKSNAYRWGFVERYENGQTHVTGYQWEPWHWRYIGVTPARAYKKFRHHSLESLYRLPAAPT